MSYLLDTNVVSELTRQKPHAHVLKWFENISDESLHISVLSIGEIRRGIEEIKDQQHKEKLRRWLEVKLPEWFSERILAIDQSIADRWGRLLASAKRSMPAIDSLIAATALHYDLRLVTRNERDFQYPTLQVINPWNL